MTATAWIVVAAALAAMLALGATCLACLRCRRLERRMRQATAAPGRIADGVAHEVDGTLTVVLAPENVVVSRADHQVVGATDILLPRIEPSFDAVTAREPIATRATRGTIAFVEDDESIRLLIAGALRERGYTLLTASCGDDAIRVISAYHSRIDLLLTDIVMPGINGHELATILRQRDPTLRVLFTSGYGADAVAQREMAAHSARLLQKPYTPSRLLNEVRAALHAPA